MQHKTEKVDIEEKHKYLKAAARLLVNRSGNFDYALKIKIDEVQMM